MEPLRYTGSFSRRVTVADGNNIVTILNLDNVNSKYETFKNDGYLVEIQALLEDLKITVNLPSLLTPPFPSPDPFGGEGAKQAELMKIRSEGQKISLGLYSANGNGPWRYESEIVLQNFGGAEHHVPILNPFLSTNETLIVDGDWKLGVKVEIKWQQPLKASDFLVVRGAYRQIVSLVKKNDPEMLALGDRIQALENLLGIMGAPTATVAGRNGLVPGARIAQENRLLRGDATWQDPLVLQGLKTRSGAVIFDANANTTTNCKEMQWLDGSVAHLNVPVNAGAIMRFDSLFNTAARQLYENQEFNNSSGRWWKRDENNGVWSAWKELAFLEGAQTFTGNKSFSGFTQIGELAPGVKQKYLTGTTAPTQGGTATIAHGLTGDKIVGVKVLVRQSSNSGVSGSLRAIAGYEYDWYYDPTNINILNVAGSSVNILSKPIGVLITYIA